MARPSLWGSVTRNHRSFSSSAKIVRALECKISPTPLASPAGEVSIAFCIASIPFLIRSKCGSSDTILANGAFGRGRIEARYHPLGENRLFTPPERTIPLNGRLGLPVNLSTKWPALIPADDAF